MADKSIYDTVHDLVSSAIDSAGKMMKPSPPSKPAYTAVGADQHIAGGYGSRTTGQIDDQVQKDGG